MFIIFSKVHAFLYVNYDKIRVIKDVMMMKWHKLKPLTFVLVLLLLLSGTVSTAMAKNNFTDIPVNSWYEADVEFLTAKGIINGYNDGSFKPNASVTRAQAAKIIANTMTYFAVNHKTISTDWIALNDVTTEDDFYDYVIKMSSHNIMQGYDDKTFKPYAPITRAQLAKILSEAFTLTPSNKALPLSDVTKNDWYYDYVNSLYNNGITTGSEGKYKGNQQVTRAQLASFVVRSIHWYEANGEKLPENANYKQHPNVVFATRAQELRELWQQKKPQFEGSMMTQQASFVIPYALGSVHRGAIDDALNITNFIREVAHLPANVQLNEAYNLEAQKGALVLAANNYLTHYPEQPLGMDTQLYKEGYANTSSSNIGMGYESIVYSIVEGYMLDEDEENRQNVGHRRWILSPQLQETGFGFVETDPYWHVGYTSMKVLDKKNERPVTHANYDFIAWPAEGAFPRLFTRPASYTQMQLPWSVSINESKYNKPDLNQVQVTLTRVMDNKQWYFDVANQKDGFFTVDNGNRGLPNAIIFQPKDFQYDMAGEQRYRVEITGLTTKAGQNAKITYETTVFDVMK